MTTFSRFFREFNAFSMENFKFYVSGRYEESHALPKHASIAVKVDQGDKVTLPVIIACKPELTLTRLLRVTLAQR